MIFLEIFANVLSRGGFHSSDQALVEHFRRVHARITQQVVQRDHLGDHGDVLSRIKEHGDLRQLHLENLGRGDIEAGALDDSVLIPLLQFHNDFDAFLLAHGTNPEDRGNVDQADAADLHEMALQIVTAPDQNIIATLAGDDEIIGNEAMPSLYKVEHALRLADSTFPGEKETNTEYVGERPVKRHGWSELHLQHRLDPAIELGGLEPGAYERDACRRRNLLEA